MLTKFYDFLFHRHEWKLIESWDLCNGKGLVKGKKYILQCTKCGNIKTKTIYM